MISSCGLINCVLARAQEQVNQLDQGNSHIAEGMQEVVPPTRWITSVSFLLNCMELRDQICTTQGHQVNRVMQVDF